MGTTKSKSIPDDEVKAYYLHTSRGLVPLPILTGIEKQAKAESKRLKIGEKDLMQEGLIPLPFDASQILTLEDNCSYFDACVRQIARDVMGQGWKIVLKRGREENKAEKEKIEYFIANSGGKSEETFGQTLEQAVIDYNSTGWLGIEASRGENSEVNGMWHIPAYTLRVHSSHNKYCQVRDYQKKWFKRFGYEEDINEESGKGDKVKEDKKAHELIYRRRYYPKSDYYGVPPILPALGAVIGLIGIRDYNLAFFENYGIPAGLVTIKGRCSEETAKQISDFIDVEIKRSENAHKTMVLRLPQGGEITYDKLSTEVKEGSFEKLDKQMRDHILSSYNMPPYQIGIIEEGPVSKDTEVLTKSGWKFIPDVRVAEKVATINLSTDRIEYQSVKKTYKDYYEKLINFRTKDKTLDILASHGHRMWTKSLAKRKSKYRWKQAGELLDKKIHSPATDFYVRTGGIYEGKNKKITPDLAAFIGWVVAEGSPRYRRKEGYDLTLYQKPGIKSEKIDFLLKRLGGTYTRKLQQIKRTGYYPNGQPRKDGELYCYYILGKFKRKIGDMIGWKKRLPKEIFEASLEARLRCLDALIEGDGCVMGITRHFYSADKILADQVVILAVLSGINARVGIRKRFIYSPRFGRKETECYEVTLYQPQWQPHRTINIIEEVDYKDHAYCLTVENGTLLYRRKGQPFIAGNSLGGTTAVQQTRIYARSTIKPIEMMINQIVTKDIIEDGLQCKDHEFQLEEMSIRDLEAEIAKDEKLFGMGAMTANQLIQKYNLGEIYTEGDERYVASKYLPAGEESIEKREQALFAGFEELKGKIEGIIKKGGKK